MFLSRRGPARRRRIVPIAWSLAAHVLVLVGITVLRPIRPDPVEARDVYRFSVLDDAPGRTAEPTTYTELPADRQQDPPERADFLSNVTSRAQDRAPGGNDALPRMDGEAESPMVALEGAGSAPPAPPSSPRAGNEARALPDLRTERSPQTGRRGEPLAAYEPLPPGSLRRLGLENAPPRSATAGNSEFVQPEASNPGNAALLGDISLNTMAWDYAPWMQQFRRELYQSWYAPMAYYLRMLKDGGWALVEITITPTGEMRRLDLLEDEGHESLTAASLEALRAAAPFPPLPADFPEPALILRLRMIYPRVRGR